MRSRRRDLALQTFLNALPEERVQVLMQFLPEEEQQRLHALPRSMREEAPSFSLENVHWSWLIPTLKSYSLQDAMAFIAALDLSVREPLGFALKVEIDRLELSPLGRGFLRQQLWESLMPHAQGVLPIEALPPSSMKKLLAFSKKGLVQCIDFLSLYDLSVEMRQIVDTKVLKTIYSILSEEKRKFLRQILDRRESFSVGRLGLERWDGQAESLRLLLHRRGLARLAGALADQESDLVWYIAHQLDIGRGHLLLKLAEESLPSSAIATMQHQVELLLDLLEVA